MTSITLTLPYPISANRYWRTFMPKGFKAPVTTLSSEAKEYKAQVSKLVTLAGIIKPILGRVAVSYVLYPHRPLDYKKRMAKDPALWDDTVQCIDLDNAQKVLFDSLKNLAFEDDKFIRRINAERAEPDGEARVVVTITPIVIESPQPALFDEPQGQVISQHHQGKVRPIRMVLRDLASQEGCDGSPFDEMVAAADYIEQLENTLHPALFA